MDKRFYIFVLIISLLHFSASVILFLLFGLGLEDRSLGSSIFWSLQQPMTGLVQHGLFPDFKLLAFPLNSIIWGFIVTSFIRLLKALP